MRRKLRVPPPDCPSPLPRSPQELPLTDATLELSGAIQAHVGKARAHDCGTYSAGAEQVFAAGLLFEWRGTWFALYVTSGNPVKHSRVESPEGYIGPGSYTATIYLRELLVGPASIITGRRIWWTGYRRGSILTISTEPRSIAIGGAETDRTDPTGRRIRLTSSTELWPTPPGYVAPFPSPVPAPDRVVNISGSWNCA